MPRPVPEEATSLRESLGGIRENLFIVAEAAQRLPRYRSSTDLHGFIQCANFNLGEAERALSVAGSS